MKKALFYMILGCVLFSCGKDNKAAPATKTTPAGKTYQVQFNVSAAGASGLTINGLHTDDTPVPISSFANVLNYWVYNSVGIATTTLVQKSGSSNYGQITDTFSPGTYTIVLVAQNIPSGVTNAPTLLPPGTNATPGIFISGFDTFFDTFTLTVSDSTVTQNVTLQRVDGQLQIALTDTIPSNAYRIDAIIHPYQELNISGLPVTILRDSTYTASSYVNTLVGQPNFTLTTYVANKPATPFTIVLNAYNNTNTVIATATINNVTTQVNTRTIVSGSLFAHGQSAVGFTVGFNEAWGTDTSFVSFGSHPLPVIKRH